MPAEGHRSRTWVADGTDEETVILREGQPPGHKQEPLVQYRNGQAGRCCPSLALLRIQGAMNRRGQQGREEGISAADFVMPVDPPASWPCCHRATTAAISSHQHRGAGQVLVVELHEVVVHVVLGQVKDVPGRVGPAQ